MKSILFKSAFLVAVAMAFTACDDKTEYEPATAPDNAQVYFSSEDSENIDLDETQTSFTIDIYRANTSGDVTVPLSGVDLTSEGLFTLPSSVTFASGASKASVTVVIDRDESKFEADKEYEFSLTIADEYTTPYGESSKTFSASYAPWTDWEYIGTGTYTYLIFWYGDDPGCPIYYRYSLTNPTNAQYRFGDDTFGLFWDVPLYVNINTETNILSIPETDTGYFYDYYGAEVYVSDVYQYTSTYTSTPNYENMSYYDPETGKFYLFVIYYIDIGYFGYDYEYMQLDGDYASYSVEISDGGQYTDASKNNYKVVYFSLSSDVATARYAVLEGNASDAEIEAAMEALNNNDNADYITESGYVGILMPEDGEYTVIALGYGSGHDEPDASAVFKFTFESTTETWTAMYVGDYYYAGAYFIGDDPGLTLFQSDSKPTRWKIEHWAYDVDFCFTYDPETGEVLVDDQEIGTTYGSYGPVYVDDMVDYMGNTSMGQSYYEDGVFYFCVIYYCSGGIFGYTGDAYGDDYETFTLLSPVSASSVKPASAGQKSISVKADLRAPSDMGIGLKATPSSSIKTVKLNLNAKEVKELQEQRIKSMVPRHF